MGVVIAEVVERLWPGRVRAIEALTKGITNSNFLVDLGDERVVVRVPGRDTALLGIDRVNEIEVGRLAASIGVGPEILLVDDTTGCIVTRFIDGRAVAAEELATEPMLAEFVSTLRRVHLAGKGRHHFDGLAVARRQRDETAARGVVAPFDVTTAFDIAERIAVARPFRPSVLCHNDLLNANFLYDGALRLVDWEYAGMADPFFDLANVAVNNGFAPESEVAMVRHYLGEADDGAMATLALMKIVSELRESMWAVMQMAISTLDFDFTSYAAERGTNLLALAEGHDVEELLGLASAFGARGT